MDDIITEVHKQQSNKKHRNSNPFPDVICIWGWCRDDSSKRTPPTFPESAPQAKNPSENESTSSSRVPVDKCNDAMEMALKAAHNVEVGDYSFATKTMTAHCCATRMRLKRSRQMLPFMCGWDECSRD